MRSAILLVAGILLLSGCFQGRSPTLTIAATAPRTEDALAVGVVLSGGSQLFTGNGTFTISYGGTQVYPDEGNARIPIREGTGSVRVPYRAFVQGNGQHDVSVRVGATEGVQPVEVVKFVERIVVLANYDRSGGALTITASFYGGTPPSPQNAVYTSGEANVTIRFENDPIARFEATQLLDEADFGFTRTVDRDEFYIADGNYTVTVGFVNDQAVQNVAESDPSQEGARVLIVEKR